VTKPRKFINPWPNAELDHRGSAFFRWQWQRLRSGLPPAPPAGSFPVAEPDIAMPRAAAGECRLTWLGHASFLLQLGGLNLLLDPMLSHRASPFARVGPARLVPVPLTVAQLPPIDAVLISHDHYDHLDEPSVRALHERFGDDLRWITPLAYQEWFAARDITAVAELDWWQQAQFGGLRITATPAQHWTRRGRQSFERLWCSFMIEAPASRVFFGGDSGYCPAFREIGEHFNGCDLAILPIGAYEPRWFMRSSHMNPEEAVQTFVDLRARTMVPMHWGTFRLTDEDMLEPPVRTRAAWQAAGLPEAGLRILRHGETLIVEK
jgi:N-acyl-phosphatidylethanolamine-hydrolysing phospholipase D